MKRKSITGLVMWTMIAGSMIAGSAPAFATTYYVRTSGNDANTGTSKNSAWKTLGKAFSTLAAGDICYIGGGGYTEGQLSTANAGTSSNPIQVIGDVAGTYTGDAGNIYYNRNSASSGTGIYISKSYWTIDSIVVSNAYDGIRVGATGDVVQNCEALSCNETGLRLDGCTSATITNCNFHSCYWGVATWNTCSATLTKVNCYYNTNEGCAYFSSSPTLTMNQCQVYGNGYYGVDCSDAVAITLNNCLIYNNTSGGIDAERYNYRNPNLTIQNCTVYQNWSGPGIRITSGTITITNCIFASNQTYGIYSSGGTITHTYNCLNGNTSGAFSSLSVSTGEITTSPSFSGTSPYPYSLQYGSPCINTGTTISGLTTDLIGTSRPLGSGYEMGCYEHDPSGDPIIGVHVLKWVETQ